MPNPKNSKDKALIDETASIAEKIRQRSNDKDASGRIDYDDIADRIELALSHFYD